ncbi:MAG TPA: YaeQ family protein [Prosthecobacter sp.]
MALKATIFKASLDISDIDRNAYSDHNLTLAQHPSETDERLMARLLAYALNVPSNNDRGQLEFGKDMWDPDEACLWQRDLTGLLVHWIEIGQPDEKRLQRVCSRAEKVTVYSFSSSTPTWWAGIGGKVTRLRNLTVWQIPAEQSQQLAAMAQRSMSLQITLQDGGLWVSNGEDSVEITLQRLYGEEA